jgi:hypothetical protein
MHLMRDMYRRDFDLFKYDFDNPANKCRWARWIWMRCTPSSAIDTRGILPLPRI